VREVARGEALLSPSVTRRLIAEFAARPTRPALTPPSMSVLTEREREVVALVAQGLTNDEIAAELVLSPATARTHVSRAMVKLQPRAGAHLVVLAYRPGGVRPGAWREVSPQDGRREAPPPARWIAAPPPPPPP